MGRLPDEALRLLDAPNLGFVATLMPDGSPHVTPVWVARENNHPIFNTVVGRVKMRNLERDPRIALCVNDREEDFHYVLVRGHAQLDSQGAGATIDALARKYTGAGFPIEDQTRINIRVEPENLYVYHEVW